MPSRTWIALWLAGCAYEAPLLPDAPAAPNGIAGTVIANGVDVPSDTIVLVYDANDPPPPAGTGSPVTFATVPASAYSDVGGLKSAPYAVSGLPDGLYLVSALMDLDGDFSPFDPSLAGATCGDLAGAHVTDLTSGIPAAIAVSDGQQAASVSIALGQIVPLERPAFSLAEGEVDRAAALNPTTPQVFRVDATAIHAVLGDGIPLDLAGPCPTAGPTCDPALTDPCDVFFRVRIVDADADGLPDLRPEGVPNVWPRVYLRLLDPPEGETWAAEAFPLGAELGAWAAGLAPQPLPIGIPVPVANLSVTWAPIAARTDDQGTSIIDLRAGGPIDDLPAGAWSVTLVAETGQTWSLPNALVTATEAEGFDPAGQGAALAVR